MCLLVCALEQHPTYPVIFAANRDEFYERPTAPAHYWDDAPGVLAGKDLRAGGTWCGVTRSGRWAAVTNYRDPVAHNADLHSRGQLVLDYLTGQEAPDDYLRRLSHRGDRYNGFNLIVATRADAWYFSNRRAEVTPLGAGIHGLSNHLLNTPWPKVERAKRRMREHVTRGTVNADGLLDDLRDGTRCADERLPDTGVGLPWERVLSSMFIESEAYGTRQSTVMLIDVEGNVSFSERTYAVTGVHVEDRSFEFQIEHAAGRV